MNPMSLAAGRSICGVSGAICNEVLDYIRSRGEKGATREEVHVATRIKHQTINPRLRELEKRNQIVNSGRTRPQSSGRSAFVWIARPLDYEAGDRVPRTRGLKAEHMPAEIARKIADMSRSELQTALARVVERFYDPETDTTEPFVMAIGCVLFNAGLEDPNEDHVR